MYVLRTKIAELESSSAKKERRGREYRTTSSKNNNSMSMNNEVAEVTKAAYENDDR